MWLAIEMVDPPFPEVGLSLLVQIELKSKMARTIRCTLEAILAAVLKIVLDFKKR